MIAKIKSLKNHQGFMKYFNSANWLFFEKIFRLGLTFIVGIYVGRYLGPENLGILSFATVVITVLTSLIKLGLNNVVYKELSEKKVDSNKTIGTAGFLIATSYLFISLLFIIVAMTGYFDKDIELVIVFILFIGNALLPFDILNQFFMSKTEAKKVAISGIASVIVFSILRVFLVIIEAELYWFAISIVIELMIKYGMLLWFYMAENSLKKLYFSKVEAKKMLSASWPFIIIGFATTIYTKIDIVMVKTMINNEAAGLYTVAIRLSDLYLFIPMTVSSVLFVAIVNALKKSKSLAKERMVSLYSFYFILAVIISFFMFLVAEFLITVLFGSDFIQAVPILEIYIWSLIFIFLQSAQNQYYIALGLQHLTMYRVVQGAVINIILNYILLKSLGVVGTAYSTVISYFYVAVIANIFHSKTRDNLYLIIRSIAMPWQVIDIFKYFIRKNNVKK